MITRALPPNERGRALGTNMVLLALGVSIGPTVGGVLTQALNWRWIFYVNLPIGALAIAAAALLLTERVQLRRQNFDLAGAAILAVGLAAITLGLSFGQEWGWRSPRLLSVMTVGLAALAGTVWAERVAPAPILNVSLLRDRVFAFANASFVTDMLALFAIGFLLPFYFEEMLGYDTLRSAAAHAASADAGRGLTLERRARRSRRIALARTAGARHRVRGPVAPQPADTE